MGKIKVLVKYLCFNDINQMKYFVMAALQPAAVMPDSDHLSVVGFVIGHWSLEFPHIFYGFETFL